MAVNKILCLKETKGRSPHYHLENAINYISNPEKTQDGKNVFGINCDPKNALLEMLEIKKSFDKTDKRQGYHFILSFSPDDKISTELCNKITKEFCEKYFDNRYQIVVATHDDKAHMHSHIVFNSVALDNGLKYHYQKGDWKKNIMPIVNELCKKYGLSTIEVGGLEDKDISFSNNKYNQSQKLTREALRKEIDELVLKAYSFNNFISLLREKKYKVNFRGATISITPPGWGKNCRLASLGENYTKESLTERIKDKNKYQSSEKIFQKSGCVIFYSSATIIGIQRNWAEKCIRELRIGDATFYVSAEYYKRIKQIKKAKEEFFMLNRNNITDKTGLEIFLERNRKFLEAEKEYKRKIRKEKKENLSLVEINNKMKSLKPCYNSYLSGNNYFKDEHDEYLRLEKVLTKKNLTSQKIEESESNILKKFSELIKRERKINKDIKIGERCLEELVEDEKNTETKNTRQRITNRDIDKEL